MKNETRCSVCGDDGHRIRLKEGVCQYCRHRLGRRLCLELSAKDSVRALVGIHCAKCKGPVSFHTRFYFPDDHVCFRCRGRTCQKCGRETRFTNPLQCSRHGGPKLESRNSSVFKAQNISDAKRLVRADLYQNFSRCLSQQRFRPERPAFLIVPGRVPSEEIGTIRAAIPDANITAFDRDRGAVLAASVAGADTSVWGDLQEINKHHSVECLRHRHFDVVVADLCSVVPQAGSGWANTWHSVVPRVAARATRFFAAVFSYGHDDPAAFEYWAHQFLGVVSCTTNDEIMVRLGLRPGSFQGVNPTVLHRVLTLYGQVWDRGFSLVRVYLYRGNRIPMMCVVFECRSGAQTWEPMVLRVSNADLRPAVLAASDRDGVRAASSLYGVPVARIAAWKAVRTRQIG